MKPFFYLLLVSILPFLTISCIPSSLPMNSEKIVFGSWAYYKNTFIHGGRVIRPQNHDDTVSEGQAYGMLRAVLMNDRNTFDECLSWTEALLSRKVSHGDHLLAWHFEEEKVSDTTAASDADVDYAFSLILASRTWHDTRYLQLAREVLKSVLDHETVIINRRLYFLPWPNKNSEIDKLVAQNPSYYAPSHFKLFYEVSGDKRWLELTDTAYELLGRLEEKGVIPDWFAIDQKGNIKDLPGQPLVYGWDAVRVPLRIAADYYIYGDLRALGVLRWFSSSFEKEFRSNIGNCAYKNSRERTYENPLFYSAAYAAMEAAGSSRAPVILERLRQCIQRNGDEFFYNSPDDYYINSLSWLPEYYQIKKEQRN